MHTIVMLLIMSPSLANILYVSAKRNKKTCFFYNFQYILRCRLKTDEKVYVQQGRLDLFEKQFGILLDNL